MAAKVKKGDEYLARIRVTRVSDDGTHVTVELPGYGTPITLHCTVLEEFEKLGR